MSDDRVVLRGSERDPVPGATRVGDVDPASTVDLTIVVRRSAGGGPGTGADPSDVASVDAFVRGAGMQVLSADAERRVVLVRATVAQASAAFGVELGEYRAAGATYRGRVGAVHLPSSVAPAVVAVLGLDDRPQARMHFKQGPPIPVGDLPPTARAETPPHPSPLWPAQVAELYSFPTGVDGTGQTIGILELGGGYRDADLDAYFEKIGTVRPTVIAVPVDGGSNAPGGDADGEVMLDIEVSGAVAPGATIAVYFADPTDRGFYDALSVAVHDKANHPTVVTISWGGPEDSWTEQARQAFDAVLA
ncbi:MAG: peptidase S53, partial [Actinobacteria bacterium]|nr:peptidase S53 [Actinomycetota bacterium]